MRVAQLTCRRRLADWAVTTMTTTGELQAAAAAAAAAALEPVGGRCCHPFTGYRREPGRMRVHGMRAAPERSCSLRSASAVDGCPGGPEIPPPRRSRGTVRVSGPCGSSSGWWSAIFRETRPMGSASPVPSHTVPLKAVQRLRGMPKLRGGGLSRVRGHRAADSLGAGVWVPRAFPGDEHDRPAHHSLQVVPR